MFIKKNKELRKFNRNSIETIALFMDEIRVRYNVELQYHDNIGLFVNDYLLGPVLMKYYSHNNDFCKYVKMNNECCQQCYNNKNKISERVKKFKKPFYGRCHMGFEEFVFPVMLGENSIGYFTVGEFYSEKSHTEQYLKKRAEETAFDYKILSEKFFSNVATVNFDISEFVTDMNMLCNSIGIYAGQNVKTNKNELAKQTDKVTKNYVVDTAIEYIFANYGTDVTLESIASACHCNSSYLSHIFKKKTGMKISEYITGVRINRAKYYLSISDYSITHISDMIGFNDSGYFSRVFKKYTGMSPDKFRKNKGSLD